MTTKAFEGGMAGDQGGVQPPKRRGQTDKPAEGEPLVTITLNGTAAACLQIDEPSIWPNIVGTKSRRVGRMGWQYKLTLPVIDAEHMLDDCISRGSQSGSEGWDQGPDEKYACRRAAENICAVLGKSKPKWWR